MARRDAVMSLLRRGGAPWLLNRFWGDDRLTVLAYHRICECDVAEFPYLVANVSATPDMFRQQMQYVSDHFNVIDLETLRRHVTENAPLPERALLITFDDGYQDNFDNAAPILREFNLPAVIFIVSGRMTNPAPLWWDEVALYFHQTRLSTVDLPLVGTLDLTPIKPRERSLLTFLEALKLRPESEKAQIVRDLPDKLDVPPMNPDEHPLFMSWSEVRELAEWDIICQPHTETHPILTRITPEQAVIELMNARDAIESEAGYPAYALAYPNGQPSDHSREIRQILRELDYDLAFTLSAGPMPYADIRQQPYQIRRVFLSLNDTFDMFVMKVMGLPALIERPEYQ